MNTLHHKIALAAVIALSTPAAAEAQDSHFNYIEGGYIAGFVNDVEEAFTDDGRLELETDSGGGGFIGGAWQVSENIHLFGDYSLAGQELEISDGVDEGEGEFDVVRWRIGVGYAYPLSSKMNLYGRLSFDNAELKDFSVAGFDLDADVDDNGVGGEVGLLWTATPALHLQGHVRYTSVGEVVTDGSGAFDADTLIGLNGRWYFRPNFAFVTGYEFGKITTWNLGVRYTF